MPKLAVRKAGDVPSPSHTSRAAQEQQSLYETFVRRIGSDVGDLELEPDEQPRSVKVRLRRASTRVSIPIEIWDADGRVYFKAKDQTKRGRSRKTT